MHFEQAGLRTKSIHNFILGSAIPLNFITGIITLHCMKPMTVLALKQLAFLW